MTSTPHAALGRLARRSVEIIRVNQDAGGAYLASPAFPVYRYSWFRDGAFIADAMSRAGEIASADAFFAWCARVITDRAGQVTSLVERARRGESVPTNEHLPTRFTVDGAEVDEEWWDFQLDGYGTWMWALDTHCRRHSAAAEALLPAVELCIDYLAAFWSEPCYDWWEEHADGVHPSTLCAIAAGLRAAVTLGVRLDVADRATRAADDIVELVDGKGVLDGHLVKTIDRGDAVDASLIACSVPFGIVEPGSPVAEATYRAIVDQLAPDGVHRYRADTFFGGGRWVVLAGFVGWYEAATGRAEDARRRLSWMRDQADADGNLPEQVTDHSWDPSFIPVWEERWGPVAQPLLWSHAMYITLADALGLLALDDDAH
jgi:GH15 family glucan-1,4-alpha-glucosidase